MHKPSPPLDDRVDADLSPSTGVSSSARRAVMLGHPSLAVASIHQGRIRKINAAWHTLFALPPDVSVESHVASLFPNSSSADRFERQMKADLAPASAGALRSEQLLMRRDRSAFLCEVIVWLLEPADLEHPLNADAIWQVRDITVERALRRELRDLGDYHRELSRVQSGITLVIDRKGRVSYASASVEGVLGHPVNALLGEPFSSLLDPADAPAAERWLRTSSQTSRGEARGTEDDDFVLRLIDREGAAWSFEARSIDCFESPKIAGLVLHAHPHEAVVLPSGEAPVQVVGASQFRPALLAMARESAAPAGSLGALLETIRTCLDASSAAYWEAVGTGPAAVRAASLASPLASPESSSTAAVAPLLSDRGASGGGEPLILDEVDRAGSHSDLAGALAASATAAVVEVPVQTGGRTRGWLAVGAPGPRRWRDAEIDFVVGSASLVARVLARDPLTGLPGRREAERHLADSTASADGRPFVVLSIDLTGLQDVNDVSGLAVGDAVIVRTAGVLAGIAGADGFVARVDGDEFVVVVRSGDLHDVASLAQSVLDGIADIGSDDAIRAQVEASVGIARVPQDVQDGVSLLTQAGLARREARDRGRGQAVIFSHKLATGLRLRKALDAEIDEALRGDEFTLFYQPQLSLSTGLVVGFEALLRWRHPTRGLLLPDAFIQAAFERGLVDVVTKLVLNQVCERIATWRRSTPPLELPVSVNVSGKQFHDRRLPALVASALLKSGLPARLLVLEITEQSLVGDDAGIERVVRELSRLGVRVAIGDFNLGHASFKYLKQLQVSQIKLGSHFVKELPGNAEDAVLVSAVVELAHRLKYEVIAEGVETRAQFEHLRAIGCESGQGFYLGAPLAAADVHGYLESNRKKPVH